VHFDPILALFAPLWLVWPSPELLLVVQACAIASAAWPVYRLAAKHLRFEYGGLGFAVAYLALPALGWMTLFDFHPVALATPLLLWAIWFLDEDRLVPFAVCALLAVTTKEHVGLALAGIGLWYAWSHRRRAVGVGIAVFGLAVSAFALWVVIAHFNPQGVSPFANRYDAVGGGPEGIVKTLFTNPHDIYSALAERHDLFYLWQLTFPLAGLFLLAPLLLVAAAPELLLNMLSSVQTQTSIHYQYSATAIAILTAAAIFGAARLRRSPALVGAIAAGASIVAASLWGPLPWANLFRDGSGMPLETFRKSAHDRVADRAVALVPDGVVVSASNSLGAHLSARRRILSFPHVRDAEWIVIDTKHPGYVDLSRTFHNRAVARVRRSPRFRLVFSEDGVSVYRARGA
jgi:uncharacterized membrane protein